MLEERLDERTHELRAAGEDRRLVDAVHQDVEALRSELLQERDEALEQDEAGAGRRAVRQRQVAADARGQTPQEAREGVGIPRDHPDGPRRDGRPAPRHEARDERLTPDESRAGRCQPTSMSRRRTRSRAASPRPWPRREPRGDLRPAGSRGTARSRGAAAAGSGIGALCGARGRPRRRSARRSGSRGSRGPPASPSVCARGRGLRALPGEDLLDELRDPEAEHRVDVIGEPESLDDAAAASSARRAAGDPPCAPRRGTSRTRCTPRRRRSPRRACASSRDAGCSCRCPSRRRRRPDPAPRRSRRADRTTNVRPPPALSAVRGPCRRLPGRRDPRRATSAGARCAGTSCVRVAPTRVRGEGRALDRAGPGEVRAATDAGSAASPRSPALVPRRDPTRGRRDRRAPAEEREPARPSTAHPGRDAGPRPAGGRRSPRRSPCQPRRPPRGRGGRPRCRRPGS